MGPLQAALPGPNQVVTAKQLRGRPIDSRRMQLQAALTLAEELGDTVLGDSADTWTTFGLKFNTRSRICSTAQACSRPQSFT